MINRRQTCVDEPTRVASLCKNAVFTVIGVRRALHWKRAWRLWRFKGSFWTGGWIGVVGESQICDLTGAR